MIHTRARTHTHTRTHMRARAHTHTHMHKHARTRVHTHTRTRAHAHTRTHAQEFWPQLPNALFVGPRYVATSCTTSLSSLSPYLSLLSVSLPLAPLSLPTSISSLSLPLTPFSPYLSLLSLSLPLSPLPRCCPMRSSSGRGVYPPRALPLSRYLSLATSLCPTRLLPPHQTTPLPAMASCIKPCQSLPWRRALNHAMACHGVVHSAVPRSSLSRGV
jgi:hypothetical protein